MAQQTINVGTAPNDGTGTPLRTAFQYTNSNFSELYTAVGPSGNNIVVPGSATISGDLTVDTSTLKVDSANNRVGIGTASPQTTLDSAGTVTISGGTGAARRLNFDASGVYLNYIESAGTAGAGYMVFAAGNSEVYRIATGGTSTWSVGGSTAMTLNSTGLGVGVASPNQPIQLSKSNTSTTLTAPPTGGASLRIQNTSSTNNNFGSVEFYNAAGLFGASINCQYTNQATPTNDLVFVVRGSGGGIEAARIDSSGNVGIGVTPSAWGAAYKAVQQQFGASFFTSNAGSIGLSGNCYNNGTNWLYASGNPATRYEIGPDAGNHRWFIAPTGTSGNPITFTQAMTLDASGNLLVGKTAASVTTVGFQTLANGEASTAMSSSTNAATTWNVYSTGAAAYRFYVGMGGTVYATNTTISAISDQRLKENVQDIDVGLGAILALKPRKFDWKAGKGKDIKGDRGFIAQEFEQVFPQLVDEWADPAPEGETPYKSVRQDLIPVLVKAIQELAAEVNALKKA